MSSPTPPSAPVAESSNEPGFWQETLRYIAISIAIVFPIRAFVAQPFIVSGASMSPTFENGEYLIVDELTYRLGEPERGDVAIFRFPQNPKKFFIKRVIGLPGETLEITGNKVTVKTAAGKTLELDESYVVHPSFNNLIVTLGKDEYWVMGDNRAESSDSRSWGTVPRTHLVGRAFLRLLPVTKAGVFPGQSTASL